MKEPRVIDPRIRGLIEEITSNPRSAVRLVPRTALLPWLEGGEAIRPSQVSRDKATRHLVEVHREELAELLYDAARIAYWKAPVMSHLPKGPDGEIALPRESEWRKRTSKELEERPERGDLELLKLCMAEVKPEYGHSLAAASLSLVPRDETRVCLASTLKASQPRRALSIFGRVAASNRTSLRFWADSAAAGRLAFVGDIEEARRTYRRTVDWWPTDWIYVFNLSCAVGESKGALEASTELERLPAGTDTDVAEAIRFIAEWASLHPQARLQAQQTARRLGTKLSNPARRVCDVYE